MNNKLIITVAFFTLFANLAFATPSSKEKGSGSKSHAEAAEEAMKKSMEHARTAGYTYGISQAAQNPNDRYALDQASQVHARHAEHQRQISKNEKNAHMKESGSQQ